MTAPTQIGIVGAGAISGDYLDHLNRYPHLAVGAIADLVPERAAGQAEAFNIPRACTVESLLADPAIEIVLNLTNPGAHAAVALAALRAGKSVYNEKPLAATLGAAREILDLAAARELRVGGAPDTFLCRPAQTARAVFDQGLIGDAVGATVSAMGHGHESWHPNPEYYYRPGGGPVLDMAPYALTGIVNILGPIRRVSAFERTTYPIRTITSEPRAGETFKVEVATHVAGVLEFVSGAIASVSYSFDIWTTEASEMLEIYGTLGSLSMPHFDGSDGTIRMCIGEGKGWGQPDWIDVPPTDTARDLGFGVGIAEMAQAIQEDRPHRVTGELAFHVLEVMLALDDSATQGRAITLESTVARPEPLPEHWLGSGLPAAG